MKTLFHLCIAAILAALPASQASALTVAKAEIAKGASPIVKVRHRRGGGLFSNWCAYNCYRVSPCARGGCYGRYHYSQYRYDQDLPFCYRWDRDASPVDNVLGTVHTVTGEPFLRLFERTY
jgi:hypothetical protein